MPRPDVLTSRKEIKESGRGERGWCEDMEAKKGAGGRVTGRHGGFAERSAKSYTKFIISQRYNVCRDSAEV